MLEWGGMWWDGKDIGVWAGKLFFFFSFLRSRFSFVLAWWSHAPGGFLLFRYSVFRYLTLRVFRSASTITIMSIKGSHLLFR